MFEYELSNLISGLIELIDYKEMNMREPEHCKKLLREMQNSGETFCSNICNIIKKKETPFTFVIGAGVSNDFGIPNWEELVFRINFSKYWQKMYSNTSSSKQFFGGSHYFELKDMFRINTNLYEWAQYAENNFIEEENDKEERLLFHKPRHIVETTLDNVLYSVVEQSLYYNAKMPSNSDYTLKQICNIVRKVKIDHVITYNYDDCFELCYERCLPIFDKQQLPEAGKFNGCKIYHVHGFIPHFSQFNYNVETGIGGKYFDYIKDAYKSYDGKKLILTELSYDDIQDKIYMWRNNIQVDTLLRYSCIFVGFSATDINFKRIVKQLTRLADSSTRFDIDELPHHYIVICIDDYIASIPIAKNLDCDDGKGGKVKYKLLKKYNIAEFIHDIKDKKNADYLYPYIMSFLYMLLDRCRYLEKYNIHPIITTIKDLPVLLGDLYKRL